MKISNAGKVLGPQSGDWETSELDGYTVLVTPGGRILRIQQLHFGAWEPSAFAQADSKFFVEAANLLLQKNKEEAERLEAIAFAEDEPE